MVLDVFFFIIYYYYIVNIHTNYNLTMLGIFIETAVVTGQLLSVTCARDNIWVPNYFPNQKLLSSLPVYKILNTLILHHG